jgi:hypothetical protein
MSLIRPLDYLAVVETAIPLWIVSGRFRLTHVPCLGLSRFDYGQIVRGPFRAHQVSLGEIAAISPGPTRRATVCLVRRRLPA